MFLYIHFASTNVPVTLDTQTCLQRAHILLWKHKPKLKYSRIHPCKSDVLMLLHVKSQYLFPLEDV